MWGSLPVYAGGVLDLVGLVLLLKPVARLGIGTRRRALLVAATGALLTLVGLGLPVSERRITRAETQLDRFAPAWQFREVHSLRIAAPPARVYQAIRSVRADEILLFRTLTWIRRGGRAAPPSILNAGKREALLDVAISGGFVRLADSTPHELVIGTVVMAPAGTQGKLTPQVYQQLLPPGFALAAMNFLVRPDGSGGSVLVTETRVFANSPAAQRRFAVYWRIIYPGSAIIRRMWLRAIGRRATAPPQTALVPPLLLGRFEDDYGNQYSVSSTEWVQHPRSRYHIVAWHAAEQYLLARNDSANPSDGGLWTRIDWLPLSQMPPYTWGFCLSAYKASSPEAAESSRVARRETPRTGCNGFPFSRMRALPARPDSSAQPDSGRP